MTLSLHESAFVCYNNFGEYQSRAAWQDSHQRQKHHEAPHILSARRSPRLVRETT